jgi:CMP-N-acetylneuraminic acid synthetase
LASRTDDIEWEADGQRLTAIKDMNEKIIAVIPIRGSDDEFTESAIPVLGQKPLVEYTLLAAKEARLLDRIIVSTDSEGIAEFCRRYDVEAPFIRPLSLSEPTATVTDVLLHCVDWLESDQSYRTDWVVKLEITHPFRPKGIIDGLIETAVAMNVDSAFLAYEDLHSYWTIDEKGNPGLVGEDVDLPRKTRRPFYRDSSGLGAVTRAANLKAGKLYGKNLGLIPIRDLFAIVDTHEGTGSSYRDKVGFRLAELLAPEFDKTVALNVKKKPLSISA